VVVIDVPAHIQIQRVMNRDRISQESAEKIMRAQLSNSERIERADLVLENAGNIVEMNAKVFKLHQNILELLSC
jgi:dephospho-CoA kinase